MLNKPKLMAVSLLTAVAVAGFAAGAATMTYAADDEPRRGDNSRWSYSGMLQQELGLTDAEREAVRAIVRRHRGEMRAVYEAVKPQIDSIQAQVRAEINAMLTPEQQARYAALTERLRAERQERMRADSGKRD